MRATAKSKIHYIILTSESKGPGRGCSQPKVKPKASRVKLNGTQHLLDSSLAPSPAGHTQLVSWTQAIPIPVVVLIRSPMVMASPKCWGLYYKRAVPPPIASHALYSGNLSLLLGVKSECLSTASSALGLLLHLRSHLHQWCLLTSHSAKPPCSSWPLHAFTTSIIWETLRCCPSSAASNRFSLCPLRITASGCRP